MSEIHDEPINRAVGPITNEDEAEGARQNLERFRTMPRLGRAAIFAHVLKDEEQRLAAWEKRAKEQGRG